MFRQKQHGVGHDKVALGDDADAVGGDNSRALGYCSEFALAARSPRKLLKVLKRSAVALFCVLGSVAPTCLAGPNTTGVVVT